MSQATGVLVLMLGVTAGCGHGYYVRIRASGPPAALADAMSPLERRATAAGFDTVWERREDTKHFPGMVYSSFVRKLSDQPHDYLEIGIHQDRAAESVSVVVACRLRGAEAALSAEINGLALGFQRDLEGLVGSEHVQADRGRTSLAAIF